MEEKKPEEQKEEKIPIKKKLSKTEKAKLKKLLKEKAEELEQIEAETKVKPRPLEEIREAVTPILKPIEPIRKLEEELAEVPAPSKAKEEKEEEKRKYLGKPSGYETRRAGTISDYVSREEDERKYVEGGLELKEIIPSSERVRGLIPRREISREVSISEEAIEKRIPKYEPERSESGIGPLARQKRKKIKKYERY